MQISGPDRGDQARGDGLGFAAIQPVEHSACEQHDALVMRSQRGGVDHRRVDQEEQRRRRTGADRDLLDDVAELPFLEIIEVCGSRLQAHDEVLAAAPAKKAAQPEPDEHSGEQGRKRGGRQPGQRLGQQRHVAQTVHSIQSVRESIEVGELRPDEVMDQRDAAKSQGIGHAEGGDELQEAAQDQQHEWRDDGAQHQAHTR